MSRRKRKTPLFGSRVEPDCAYCLHNAAREDEPPRCSLRKSLASGKCKAFSYDPLMRAPTPPPPLRRERYREEDFKL